MKPAKEKEHPLSASIKYHRTLSGYSREQICELLDFSISTYHIKLAEPNKFTLNEIIKLSKLFDTTDFILIMMDMQGKRGKELHKQLIVS